MSNKIIYTQAKAQKNGSVGLIYVFIYHLCETIIFKKRISISKIDGEN